MHHFIPGEPKPQGSKNGYIRGGKVVLVEANKDLPTWRNTVRDHILRSDQRQLTGAIWIEITFHLPKPKTVTRQHATSTYDIDKLTRAILDAITQTGLWRDDADVIELIAKKQWGDTPGVEITLGDYTDENTIS